MFIQELIQILCRKFATSDVHERLFQVLQIHVAVSRPSCQIRTLLVGCREPTQRGHFGGIVRFVPSLLLHPLQRLLHPLSASESVKGIFRVDIYLARSCVDRSVLVVKVYAD